MKKFRFLAMAAAVAMMLGSCSDDDLNGGGNNGSNNPEAEDGVYFSIGITLPNAGGSRSVTDDPEEGESTSDAGTEIGQDYENTVTEAIVVLADPDNLNFVAAATVNAANLTKSSTGDSYTALSKFSKTALQAFYDGPAKDKYEASVFVFCNPTNYLRNAIFGDGTEANPGAVPGKDEWLDAMGNVGPNAPIWARNNFLMSNSKIAKRQIPSALDGWNYYTTESKPFNLSGNNPDVSIDNEAPIRVQRAAARFDFRDGSGNNCTYEVVSATILGDNDTEQQVKVIDIELQKMALVNIAKKYYFLERVSADGTDTGWEICKPEQPWIYNETGGVQTPLGNYVVSPEWTWKRNVYNQWKDGNTGTLKDFADKYNYPFFDSDGNVDNNNISNDRWATSLVKDVINGDPDIDDGWTQDPKGDYRIWRYATENTIPSADGNDDDNLSVAQVNGFSTGVVFKGKMKVNAAATNFIAGLTDEQKEATDVKNLIALVDAIEDDEANANPQTIYLYAGNLYLGWDNVKKAAIAAAAPEFKWVPVATEENGGHWELIYINRTNSFYKLVFGNGGFGTHTFRFRKVNADGSFTNEYGDYTYTDLEAADEESANSLYEVWQKDEDSKKDTTKKLAFKKKVTALDMALYERSQDPNFGYGYYCYYYYWNRHHDNGNNGVMGPMEFAVVRNNVYKLAVTKISRLGHPRISENDPDKPTPGTPDESEDVYITVTAEVLPWVVRLNDIKF